MCLCVCLHLWGLYNIYMYTCTSKGVCVCGGGGVFTSVGVCTIYMHTCTFKGVCVCVCDNLLCICVYEHVVFRRWGDKTL